MFYLETPAPWTKAFGDVVHQDLWVWHTTRTVYLGLTRINVGE